MKTATQPERGGFELFSEFFLKAIFAASPFVALGVGLGLLLVPFSSPPTTEEIDREFLIMKQRPEDHFYNKASGSAWKKIDIVFGRQELEKKSNAPYYPGEVLFLRPDTAITVEIEAIGSRDTLFLTVEMGEYFQHRFEKESMTFLIPHRRLNVYVKLWQPFWSSIYGLERYSLGFFLLAYGLGGVLLLFFWFRRMIEMSAREGKPNIAAGTKTDVHEPEVVEAEELTEEEAREIMKPGKPASVKLDSTKELHTVQDLLSQTVAEIEAAQNNPGKLTQIIRNKKTRFQDESWRKLVVSKLTKLETILAVKEVIIKDQELNRELGTAYLDDQIKIKEKENRLAELDANTAEWKKKARDHEKEDEEPIITPSTAELKGEKIRERLEEKDAMRKEFRTKLKKLFAEEKFLEGQQEEYPDDKELQSRLLDVKNQIQDLEMKLKNL